MKSLLEGYIDDIINDELHFGFKSIKELSTITIGIFIDGQKSHSMKLNVNRAELQNRIKLRVKIPHFLFDGEKHIFCLKLLENDGEYHTLVRGEPLKIMVLESDVRASDFAFETVSDATSLTTVHMNPKLSIVVPVFNVEKYLDEALTSLVSQSLSDTEIIIINDCSTDGSGAICEKFAQVDARIKYHPLPANRGYGFACNFGLKMANGDYVTIFEPDDYISADAYLTAYNKAFESDLDMIRFGYCNVADGTISPSNYSSVFKIVPADEVFSILDFPSLLPLQPTVWGYIYKRDFIDTNNINFLETPGASFQDISFNFKTLALATRTMALKDNFYFYRQHPEQSVKNTKIKAPIIEFKEIHRFCEATIKSRYSKQDAQKIYIEAIVRILASFIFHMQKRMEDKDRKLFFDEFMLLLNEILFNNPDASIYCAELAKRKNYVYHLLKNVVSYSDYLMRTRYDGEVENLPALGVPNTILNTIPKVTVGIPLHNSEKYLQKCLDSVISQTMKEIDIILVDDASPDNSISIARKYQETDKRIRIFQHPENMGLGNVRNTCIRKARAPYVLLIDSDDWIAPDMCEIMHRKAISSHADMVVCGVKKVYEDTPGKTTDFVKYSADQEIENVFHQYMTTSTIIPAVYHKLFKKSIFIENNIQFPGRIYHQDIATMLQYVYYCKKVLLIPEQLYFYLQRNGSAVTSCEEKHIHSVRTVLRIVRNFLLEKGLFESYSRNFFGYYFFERGLRSHFSRIAQFSNDLQTMQKMFEKSIKEIFSEINLDELTSILTAEDIMRLFGKVHFGHMSPANFGK